MPSTTPRGYPYPLGTDRVMDGDDAIHNLASAVDEKLGVTAAGTGTVTTTAADVIASTAITFPAGRFTRAPLVFCQQTSQLPSSSAPYSTVFGSGVTAAGFNLACRRANAVAVTANWFATTVDQT